MTILQQIEDLLPSLTRLEKARLLVMIVNDLTDIFPGVFRDPAVNGGDPTIVRTRIPVWLLVQMRQLGVTAPEFLTNYPTLIADDLNNAWSYYAAHTDEIDSQIQANEEA